MQASLLRLRLPGFDLGNSPEDFTPEAAKIGALCSRQRMALVRFTRLCTLITYSLAPSLTLQPVQKWLLSLGGISFCYALELMMTLPLRMVYAQACSSIYLKAVSSVHVETDDFGEAMLGLYKHAEAGVMRMLSSSGTGKRLIKMGHKRDVERCGQVDSSIIVPRLLGDMIVQG